MIDSCVSGQKVELVNVANIISFLSDFTGVPSESNGNDAGQMSPTREDHWRWHIWLEINKSFLFMDITNKRLFLRKEVSLNDLFPPPFMLKNSKP